MLQKKTVLWCFVVMQYAKTQKDGDSSLRETMFMQWQCLMLKEKKKECKSEKRHRIVKTRAWIKES